MRKTGLPIAGFEDDGRGHEPRNRQPLQPGKGKEMDPPLEPPEATQSYQHFDLSPVTLRHSKNVS